MFSPMRTTLNIDSDVVQAPRSIARARSVSLGPVVSELIRKGLEAERRPKSNDPQTGFPVLSLSQVASPITLDDLKRAEDE